MEDASQAFNQTMALARTQLVEWYESNRSTNGAEPERYVVAAGLYITEALKDGFPIERDSYDTGKGQVRYAGKSRLQKILKKHGETRVYASEGGRTTRSTLTAASDLALRINSVSEIANLSKGELQTLAEQLQGWVAQRAIEFFNRERIKIDIDRGSTLEAIIDDILAEAGKSARYKSGPTAQHLVGAKLEIRFASSGIAIDNHSTNAADVQTRRLGDFQVRDTVFHVTLAPSPDVIEKCVQNLREGKRVVLLVPKENLEAARQMARLSGVIERVAIAQSLSAFIGQNIEELGEYSQVGIERELKRLLDTYNSRVAEVETDLSIQIEIPQWLQELNP